MNFQKWIVFFAIIGFAAATDMSGSGTGGTNSGSGSGTITSDPCDAIFTPATTTTCSTPNMATSFEPSYSPSAAPSTSCYSPSVTPSTSCYTPSVPKCSTSYTPCKFHDFYNQPSFNFYSRCSN